MSRRTIFHLVVLSVFTLPLIPAMARAAPERTILIVTGGLSYRDLLKGPYPSVRSLATQGAAGLLNTAVQGPARPASALLTLVSGKRSLMSASKDSAAITLDAQRRAQVLFQELGQPEAPVLFCIPKWRNHDDYQAFQEAVSSQSGEPFEFDPARPAILARHITQRFGNAVILFPSDQDNEVRSNLDRLVHALRSQKWPRPTRLVVVSAWPRPARDGVWDRLGFIVIGDSTLDPGLLVSPTTRTAGLVANVDLQPTLLRWIGKPVLSGSEGRPMETTPCEFPLSALRSLDQLVYANARALAPHGLLMAVLVVFSFGAWAMRDRSRAARSIAPVLLLSLLSWPLALVLASAFFRSASAGMLVLLPALLSLAIGGIAAAALRAQRHRLTLVLGVSCLVFLVDGVRQGALIRFSMLSGYQLQGIRYYGIGNEYMGILLGTSVLLPGLLAIPRFAGVFFGCAVTLVLGLPLFGADAGGLIASVVTFGCLAVAAAGKPCRWTHAAGFALAGLAVAFLIAALDARLSGESSSHLGRSVLSARTSGAERWVALAAGKIGMHARILVQPATLAGIAAFAISIVIARTKLRLLLEATQQTYPAFGMAVAPAGWGALSALLFNDSGIVSALMMLGVVLVSGMILAFNVSPREPGSPPLP